MFTKSYNHKVLGILIPLVLFALSLGLGVIQPTEAWASDTGPSAGGIAVSLTLSSSAANPGNNVTAAGVADAAAWVSIKIVDSAQNIVFYDAIKSGADGTYSDTFKVPSEPGSILTVVAGYGSNVATRQLNVSNGETIPVGTVIFGNGQALDLSYANSPAHSDEVRQDVISGGTIYVISFAGQVINNSTGAVLTDLSVLPAVTYKDANGNIKYFASGDGQGSN